MVKKTMSDNDKRIAVLIPCFNEAAAVGKVVRDFRRVLPEAEVYVYDNNSTDGTGEIAAAAGAHVVREWRQGKGNVVRSMFRGIDADCYIMVDGDDTYPAENAREMADLIFSGAADMVIGDRLGTTYFGENKRPFHGAGNRLVRWCINRLWGEGKIRDVMTGYRAFSPLFVKSFPVLSEGFEIETEMTVYALDARFLIRSIPVSYRDRPAGSVSKLRTFRDGAKVLHTIFSLYKDYKPLPFFTGAAAILAVLSLVLFLPVFAEYMATGLVPRFPTLITSGFLMTAALLSFGVGVILDTEVKSMRKTREIQMNLITMLQKGSRKF